MICGDCRQNGFEELGAHVHAKGMAIRGLVSGRGPALLGRMSASEPFACTWGPRGRKQVPSPRHGI